MLSTPSDEQVLSVLLITEILSRSRIEIYDFNLACLFIYCKNYLLLEKVTRDVGRGFDRNFTGDPDPVANGFLKNINDQIHFHPTFSLTSLVHTIEMAMSLIL